MAKEVLAIPEKSLAEVIAVIRAGLKSIEVSDNTRRNLEAWCNTEEQYLEEG
jgi:hypothetical protein